MIFRGRKTTLIVGWRPLIEQGCSGALSTLSNFILQTVSLHFTGTAVQEGIWEDDQHSRCPAAPVYTDSMCVSICLKSLGVSPCHIIKFQLVPANLGLKQDYCLVPKSFDILASLWIKSFQSSISKTGKFYPYCTFILPSNSAPQSAHLEFPKILQLHSHHHLQTHNSLLHYVINNDSFLKKFYLLLDRGEES